MSNSQGNEILIKKVRLISVFTFELFRPTYSNITLQKMKEILNSSFDVKEEEIKEAQRMYNPIFASIIDRPLILNFKKINIKGIPLDEWQRKSKEEDRRIPGPPIYQQTVNNQNVINSLIGKDINITGYIYPNGIISFLVDLSIEGNYQVDNIISLLRFLFRSKNYPIITDYKNKSQSLIEIISDIYCNVLTQITKKLNIKIETFRILKVEKLGNEKSKMGYEEKLREMFIDYADVYTIVEILEIEPSRPGYEIFYEYYDDIKGLAVGVLKYYKSLENTISKELGLVNKALEKPNILWIGPRNTLVYMPIFKSEKYDGVFDIVIRPIEVLRSQMYILQLYDAILSDILSKSSEMRIFRPADVKEKLIELEELRREIADSLEDFRRLTTAISFRVQHVFKVASTYFQLDMYYKSINEKLTTLDIILDKAYAIFDRERAEKMTMASIILSIIFSGSLSFAIVENLSAFLALKNIKLINEEMKFPLSLLLWLIMVMISEIYLLKKTKPSALKEFI